MTSMGKFIKRLLLAAMLLIVAFHILVAGLLLIWKTQPINNSMFMLSHRLTGGSVTQTWVEYDAIAKSAKQAAITPARIRPGRSSPAARAEGRSTAARAA